MAQLVKQTAVICHDVFEFTELTQFRHKEGVEEYFHVATVDDLNRIDMLTNIIYLRSAKLLEEFHELKEAASKKGVSERWQ